MNFRATLYLIIFAAQISVFSQRTDYPYIKVTPTNPITTDNVSVQVILGEHPNACVPTYTTSFKIVDNPILCLIPPCPIEKIVTIQYTAIDAGPGICLPALTEYGPSFNLKTLAAGTYRVTDKGGEVGNFIVTSPPIALSGTVTEDTGPLKILKLLAGVKVYIAEPIFFWPGPGISNRRLDSTVTNSMGQYSFPKAPSGNYQIQFFLDGYQTYFPTVTLSQDTVINAALLPMKAVTSIGGKAEHIICGIISCDPHPLPGVEITLSLPQMMGDIIMLREFKDTTDDQGNYSLKDLPFDYNTSTVQMVAKKIDFQDDRKTGTLTHIISPNVNFMLTRLAPVSETKTVNGVEFRLSSPGSEFSFGQEVSVTYSVNNTNTQTVGYDFNTAPGCHYELEVYNDKGVRVYSYVSTLRCLQVQNTLSIAPGETVTSSFPARVLNPGKYTFTGSLNGHAFSAVSLEITINNFLSITNSIQKSLSLSFEGGLHIDVNHPQRLIIQGYNVNGKSLHGLNWEEYFSVGKHSLKFNTKIPSGQYLFVIKSEENIYKQKILVP